MLQLRQIRNHTDAPAATDDTAVPGMGEWLKVTDFKQENPVPEPDHSSDGQKTIMHNISKLHYPPHNEDNQSPGPYTATRTYLERLWATFNPSPLY